ncbi:MAG: hypothetical protein ACH254_02170 [Candidatus Thiodiazotropha endolucinida]
MQLIAGCVLSACVFACDAADLIESTSKGWKAFANKPFSAVLVEYRRDSEAVYSKSRIYLSPMGMRTERLSVQNSEPELIVIKNHHTEQVWLINPVQHYFTELPSGKTKDTERVIEGEKRPLLGVLANEPCYGMRAEKGFYPEFTDTSKKADNGRGGVSCRNAENTQRNTKEKLWP